MKQPIQIQYRKTDALTAYVGNARNHSDAQVEEIARSIDEFGFYAPIIIDESDEVIAGHGRLLAAKSRGMEKVPVVKLSHLSDRQKKAMRLADNKIAQKSTWDFAKLSEELSLLAETDFELSLTGFDEQELDALLKNDASVLPDSWTSQLLPTQTGEGERTAPQETTGQLVEVKPRATDDEYSTFEIVMLHSNKVELVDKLSQIRSDKGFDKLEDALMECIRNYGG